MQACVRVGKNIPYIYIYIYIYIYKYSPAPACQGPPSCGGSFIHSILHFLLSYLATYPYIHKSSIRKSHAKSPPYPPEPQNHDQMPLEPICPYFISPQDPPIRVAKRTLSGPEPPICVAKHPLYGPDHPIRVAFPTRSRPYHPNVAKHAPPIATTWPPYSPRQPAMIQHGLKTAQDGLIWSQYRPT
jgi:hypothetical protein